MVTPPDGYAIDVISTTNGTITSTSTEGNYVLRLSSVDDAAISATFKADDWASTGAGTEADPYKIYNTDQLDKFSADVNQGTDFSGKHFRLMADLAYDKTVANNFTPIGQYSSIGQYQFKGTFDGRGHTISGINITRSVNTDDDNYVGLFGYTFTSSNPAVIKNLKLDNSTFTGFKYVAPIMAYNGGAHIENCHVGKNVVVATSQPGASYHGGIAGDNIHSGRIEGCTSAASITAPADETAGTSYTGSTVYVNSENYGGIVGANYTNGVYNCLYLGTTVQGKYHVGAIMGLSSADNAAYQQRNFYRGMKTYYRYDQSVSKTATNVGIGSCGTNNPTNDYDGARQAYRRVSTPDGIGSVVKTYGGTDGDDDFTGIVAYDNCLYYNGGYYTTEPLSLADNADNSVLISANKVEVADEKGEVDIVLTGRKLWKDNSWNTLCLPFAISDFKDTPLEGATVKTLSSATFDNGTLTLNFSTSDLTEIQAGKPYIVKWASGTDISDPVFAGVVITSTEPADVVGDAANFHGIYSPYSITGEDKTMLYMGADNKLYYPNANMTINAFRAYFTLIDGLTAGEPTSSINTFVLHFGNETNIIENGILKIENEAGAWYDLLGRRLSAKPLHQGIYINNGKKVIIK